MVVGMGLREKKKQETRSALSWAAIRLIVERGADNVLVEDIAAAAGVSPRTFNNYFSSKGEAVASRHLDRIRQMAEDLRARPASEPLWDAITEAALMQLEPGPEVTAHPPPADRNAWAAGVEAMVSSPSLQAEMLRAGATAERSVAAAVASRTGLDPETDLYPKLVAAALLAVINVISQHWTTTGGSTDVRTLTRKALAEVRAGLPPPAA
jgi:AcrR family transcriptional regulator